MSLATSSLQAIAGLYYWVLRMPCKVSALAMRESPLASLTRTFTVVDSLVQGQQRLIVVRSKVAVRKQHRRGEPRLRLQASARR